MATVKRYTIDVMSAPLQIWSTEIEFGQVILSENNNVKGMHSQ